MRKFACLLLALALLAPCAARGELMDAALETAPPIPLLCESAVLVEPESGQILFEQNADERRPVASVTKIMAILLALEALEAGRATLEDPVPVSQTAAGMGGSQVLLDPGETQTVDALLKSAIVGSANDASVAIAEALYGSESVFVERMNERARELGLTNTHFVNCTGLDDGPDADTHLTTAYDIALMSRALLQHDEIKQYTTIWMDTVRNGQFGLSNTNKLVRFYDGTTGLKTGYTSQAGYCLSASAERGGMELIAVVMHCKSSVDRFESAKALLNYGFSNYALVTPEPEDGIPPVPVVLGTQEFVTPVPQSDAPLLLEKARAAQIRTSVETDTSVRAPVAAGQQLGRMTVTAGDETVAEIPLVAPAEIPARTFLDLWAELLGKICFSQ